MRSEKVKSKKAVDVTTASLFFTFHFSLISRLRKIPLPMSNPNLLLFQFSINNLDLDLSIRSVQRPVRRLIRDQILRTHFLLYLSKRLA